MRCEWKMGVFGQHQLTSWCAISQNVTSFAASEMLLCHCLPQKLHNRSSKKQLSTKFQVMYFVVHYKCMIYVRTKQSKLVVVRTHLSLALHSLSTNMYCVIFKPTWRKGNSCGFMFRRHSPTLHNSSIWWNLVIFLKRLHQTISLLI